MREVEEALARWRNAERRFITTEPGSLDHTVALLECEEAQALYERLVGQRRTAYTGEPVARNDVSSPRVDIRVSDDPDGFDGTSPGDGRH